jgi:hypothetical protein
MIHSWNFDRDAPFSVRMGWDATTTDVLSEKYERDIEEAAAR